jgi:hypothetical protein
VTGFGPPFHGELSDLLLVSVFHISIVGGNSVPGFAYCLGSIGHAALAEQVTPEALALVAVLPIHFAKRHRKRLERQ